MMLNQQIRKDSSGFATASNALLLGVACVLIWLFVFSRADGKLHVYFLDIGQGDGIFIQTPSGRQVLIDGGESPQRLFSELGEVMPFWDRSLDLIVLSHPDGDHMFAQIDLPTRFDVDIALESADSRSHEDSIRWREAMQHNNTTIMLHQSGDWIDLGDGVSLHTIWPPPEGYRGENEDNENSIVMKLVYGQFSVLLTGDTGLPSEKAWLTAGIDLSATVLKVGHHGSRGSTGRDFVEAVDPLLSVIQVGENSYGHPNQEVLDNLAGRKILCNVEHGRVHVYSDSRQMYIEEERNPDAFCQTNYSPFGR